MIFKSPERLCFLQKKTEKLQKLLYISSHSTQVRPKTTGKRSKNPQYDDDFFDLIPEISNFYRISMFTLKNRVKTRQRNHPSNVTIFRTLDRKIEIL